MRVTGRNSWSQTFKGKASLLRDLKKGCLAAPLGIFAGLVIAVIGYF